MTPVISSRLPARINRLPPERQRHVVASEGERVGEGQRRTVAVWDQRPRLAGDVVQVAVRIRDLVAQRGRDHPGAQDLKRGHRLHRARRPQEVTDGRFGGGDRYPPGPLIPSARLMAAVSAGSLSGVEVPWALT